MCSDRALQGVGVLVTRPVAQALSLCRLLEARGAHTATFPALDIEPLPDLPRLAQVLGDGPTFDLVIFTSANAVRFGASLFAPHRTAALAAIGPATARALAALQFSVTITPRDGFDSEHLLATDALREIAGRHVLIVKGRDGRELLADELRRRGASVVCADVYARVRVVRGATELQELTQRLANGEFHVITATSAAIAAALLEPASPQLHQVFSRLTWVVPGARVAGALHSLGCKAPILEAASADDQDLVAALCDWRSAGQGA